MDYYDPLIVESMFSFLPAIGSLVDMYWLSSSKVISFFTDSSEKFLAL